MRFAKRFVASLAIATACLAAHFTHAEDIEAQDAREAIRSATERFVRAFNTDDTATMAVLWSQRGEFIDDKGQRIFFQDRIAAAATAAKSAVANGQSNLTGNSSLVMTVNSVRLVTDKVAMADGNLVYKSSPDALPGDSRYTAVWVLKDFNWVIDNLRTTPVSNKSHNAHLTELEWLIGDWMDNAANPRFEWQVRPSAGGNYLDCQFKTELPGRGAHAGSMRIGWDPECHQFRSWTFNEDGSFATGLWMASEKGWTIETQGVTAEGQRTADQIQIAQRGSSAAEWTFENGTLAGQPLPDFRLPVYRSRQN